MLLNLIIYSAIVLFMYAFWYRITSAFITLFSIRKFSYIITPHYFTHKALFFHFLLVCFWFLFALFLADSIHMQSLSFSHIFMQTPSILFGCLFFFCICVHILSVLDYRFLSVPNILLLILFATSLCFYYVVNGFYSDLLFNDFPFMILGMAFVFYFLINLFSFKEILGLGDVWVFASMSIILESLFSRQAEVIFEFLFVSSLFAILYNLFLLISKKKLLCDETLENKKEGIMQKLIKDSKNPTHIHLDKQSSTINIQIPFIPFLTIGFIIVSVWHAS